MKKFLFVVVFLCGFIAAQSPSLLPSLDGAALVDVSTIGHVDTSETSLAEALISPNLVSMTDPDENPLPGDSQEETVPAEETPAPETTETVSEFRPIARLDTLITALIILLLAETFLSRLTRKRSLNFSH